MSFFKTYDMRGTFGVDFDLETVHKVGKALPVGYANGLNEVEKAVEKFQGFRVSEFQGFRVSRFQSFKVKGER